MMDFYSKINLWSIWQTR